MFRICGIAMALLVAGNAVAAELRFDRHEVASTTEPGQTQVHAEFSFTVPAQTAGSPSDGQTRSTDQASAIADAKTLPGAGALPGGVTITEVKTSCGCTTATLEKKTYAPGESGKIAATFVIGDRTGEQIKHIRVHWTPAPAPAPGSGTPGSGEPEQVTTLTMRVTVPELLRVTPRFVYWRPGDDKTAKTVTVTVGEGQSIHVTGVASSTEDVKAEVRMVEAGKRYTLTITPLVTDRPTRSVITLKTDHPAVPPEVSTIHARLVPARAETLEAARVEQRTQAVAK